MSEKDHRNMHKEQRENESGTGNRRESMAEGNPYINENVLEKIK